MTNIRKFAVHSRTAVGVSRKQLERALLVSAQLTKRYKETAFEGSSLDLFERMERELALAEQRISIRERADAILNKQPRNQSSI